MFESIALAAVANYSFYCLTFGALLLAEAMAPRETIALRDRVPGLVFWAILIPIDATVLYLGGQLRDALGIEPIVTYSWDVGSAILAAILGALGVDLVFYWFHRFQHRFLWRFHSVHHSIENLSATNSYHHWSEPFWNVLLIALPLSFLSVSTVNQALWLALLLRAYPYYIHSPIKLHAGPLARWLIDNRYHRIHHSVEERHFDKNFGALTTFWDRLFGTAYFPTAQEWPEVGITAHREPKTLVEWLRAGERSPAGRPPTDRSAETTT